MSILVVLLLSIFISAEDFFIHRLENHHNQAVIATLQAETFKVGDEFAIETPQGRCYANVTQIITDYIYVNTEQCQIEYLQKGTPVISTKKVIIEKNSTPQEITFINSQSNTNISSAPIEETSNFYKNYMQNRLSLPVSYLTGTALTGRAPIGASTFSEDWKGSNTIGFGADYNIIQLPYNLSVSAGTAYNLPRSYGRFKLVSPTSAQTMQFNNTPRIETLSLYSNIRYHFNNKTLAYIGLNHLFARDSSLPGEMNGDFGFHTGARHYVFENFYAEASLDFYNLNYELNNKTSDFSLTELEVKAGYTF